jgi:hypothetical protein
MLKEQDIDKSLYWKVNKKIMVYDNNYFKRMKLQDLDGTFGVVFPVRLMGTKSDSIMMVKVAKGNFDTN